MRRSTDRRCRAGRERRPHRAAGRRRLCRLPPRARCRAGHGRGAEGDGHRQGAALSRHLRRHAADGDARPGKDRSPQGLGWIAGAVKEIVPADPALKIPQIGWNTIHVKQAHPLFAGIPTGEDGLHAYFVHSYHLAATDPGRRARDDRLWRPGHRRRRPRQHGRHPVPSRKEPDARPGPDRQFPEVEAMILFPAIDLKDGQCVRLKLGDMDSGDRLQRRPRRAGEGLRGPGLRMAACRRPQRRLCRRERQWRGGRGDPEGDEESRCSSAAASARSPISRAGWTRAWPASSSAPSPCAIPSWSRKPAGVSRASRRRHRRQGRQGRGRGLGGSLDARRRSSWRRRFEGAGVAAIIYTDIDRDGVLTGINWDVDARAGRRGLDPGHRLGRPGLAWTISCA